MPQGLQVWDASGTLIFDGSSRMLKFYAEGAVSVTFSGATKVFATLPIQGINPADTIAVAYYYSPILATNVPLGVSVGANTLYLRREPTYDGTYTVTYQLFKF